ncbi:MAG TPA: FAD-linked oxidase C-terminal domain-containing protein, partial [Chloroflexota bacterium]
GQGCIHTRIDFDLRSPPGIARFRAFIEDAADLVVRYGGSLSGEHGDGQARGELLDKMFGPELLEAFREFKAIWDPSARMNPGKLIDAYPLDANLRLAAYPAPEMRTEFGFPDDEHTFAEAALRCVGVGRCRKMGPGTMCPSYMVTGDERHSTRGRARLLFEMLQGDPVRSGWRDHAVKEALDLCLACKACKSECPVNVDMATYKAEFLSHYYAGRPRPLVAYAFGLIFLWARLASRAPWLANLFTQTPGPRDLAKRLIGIAPERRLPAFARTTFKRWFARRPSPAPHPNPPPQVGRGILPSPSTGEGEGGGEPAVSKKAPVLLWPDTFTNYFHPEIGRAAVEVIEAAGFEVVVPEADLCCGRPLYDYGMLGLAKRVLFQTLEVLRPHLEAGTPIVGLEPSCIAVFRDELPNLFPNEPLAARLHDQAMLFSEFVDQHASDFDLPKLSHLALVHGHCHQKALMGMDNEQRVLDRLGLDYQLLDAGCCGMAGSFGFEAGARYEVSRRLGERVLLPAVREASPETLIIADGFSCREQIAQGTGRQALHLAQLIQLALRKSAQAPG